MMTRLSCAWHRRLYRSWDDCRAIFILSTGRVGTVSLIRLLNLSPELEAHHEPTPTLIHLMPRAFNEMSQRPQHYSRLFLRARARLLHRASQQDRTYVEATLLKHYAPVIADLLPHARFIHIHRHPGGVIRSTMRRGWYDNHPYDSYRPWPGPTDPAHKHWPDWEPFDKNCWLWAEENERFLQLADSIGPGRVLRLSYEELFNQTATAASRIFAFSGTRPPDSGLIQQALARRHNQQHAGQFPKYQHWSHDQLYRLDAIAGATMDKLDYTRPCSPGQRRAA